MAAPEYGMLSYQGNDLDGWKDEGYDERHANDTKDVSTDAPSVEQPPVVAESFVTSGMLGMTK